MASNAKTSRFTSATGHESCFISEVGPVATKLAIPAFPWSISPEAIVETLLQLGVAEFIQPALEHISIFVSFYLNARVEFVRPICLT